MFNDMEVVCTGTCDDGGDEVDVDDGGGEDDDDSSSDDLQMVTCTKDRHRKTGIADSILKCMIAVSVNGKNWAPDSDDL